jgi:uncharacterized membrane protein YkvA (DUF1232 family)
MPRVTSFFPSWKNLYLFMRDPHSDWKPKVGVVLAVVYIIWPIDLIPDFVPIIGWLDDIGITALAVAYLLHTASRYEETLVAREAEEKKRLEEKNN